MKETILKRLKKYNTGGTMMSDAQPILETAGKQGVKTGLSRAFSNPLFNRVLGLGSGVLSTGAAGYEFFKGYGKNLPNMGVNVGNLAENSGLNIAGSMKQMGGVQPLPGGVMAPIPGSDAVEFMGNKHDESGMGSDSGIMVDQNTEVEGGETMDQVVMNKGGARDYFFSDHLKKGGMSYAQHHKNILQNGGGQQEVNMLAKMQEKAANRDPKQVAKLGGVVEYNEGGGRINMEQIRNMYPTYATEMENLINFDPLAPLQTREEQIAERRAQKMDARRRPVMEGDMRTLQNLQLFVDQGRDLTGEQQIKYDALNALYNPAFDIQQPEKDTKDPFNTKQIVKQNAPEDFAKLYPKEVEEEAKEKSRLARLLNTTMPTPAKVGLAAAFLPVVGAMLTKQKDLEEYKYTPGFESPIVAGRVKGQTYDAPNQDAARAAVSRLYTGQNLALDRAGLGPGDQSNRQLNYSKSLNALSNIGAQESKDRLTAENLSKQSQQKAEMMNVQNELKAASVNAQMIQREAARKAAVDSANVTAKNMRESEKISNRMAILNTLGQGIGTVMGDKMAFDSQERIAKAFGSDGIYQRDILSNYLRKQNPGASDDEINLLTIETLNKLKS